MNSQIRKKVADHFSDLPIKEYRAGEIIYQAGQRADKVFLLLDGLVEQYAVSDSGRKVVTGILKPGFFFNMSYALNSMTNPCFYGAVTGVSLQQIDPANAMEYIAANPDVMLNYIRRLNLGLNETSVRYYLAVNNASQSRLAFELMMEALYFGDKLDSESNRSLIQIKRQALADRSGLVRETISRGLTQFMHEGVIQLADGGVIVDIARIEELLGLSFRGHPMPNTKYPG